MLELKTLHFNIIPKDWWSEGNFCGYETSNCKGKHLRNQVTQKKPIKSETIKPESQDKVHFSNLLKRLELNKTLFSPLFAFSLGGKDVSSL